MVRRQKKEPELGMTERHLLNVKSKESGLAEATGVLLPDSLGHVPGNIAPFKDFHSVKLPSQTF